MKPSALLSNHTLRGVFVGLVALASGIASASALPAIVTVPGSLSPGEHYRLVFVTSGTTDALSADISTYNAFVTAQANLATELMSLGTTWTIIGSTVDVSAKTNTGTDSSLTTGVPIFTLDGTNIAANNAAFWSGSLMGSGINLNQFGNAVNDYVWTGTTIGGTSDFERELGNDVEAGSAYSTTYGHSGFTNFAWVNEDYGSNEFPLRAYAISGDLVVAPEPASAALLLGAGAVLLLRRRRHTAVL